MKSKNSSEHLSHRISLPVQTRTRISHPITLAVDIGGSGLKLMAVDARGNPLTERLRTPTPDPATPARMLAALKQMKKQMPPCDRVSVGFPGVIKQGKTLTAANLNPRWIGFPLAATLQKRWKMPVRLANDAAVQGYGAISGKGVELVLTLGTGMGSALFTNGHLCPGLELGHHPWRKGKTYEDYLGTSRPQKAGQKTLEPQAGQSHRANRAYLQLGPSLHRRRQRQIHRFQAARNVSIISNEDGLFGGVALWRYPGLDAMPVHITWEAIALRLALTIVAGAPARPGPQQA